SPTRLGSRSIATSHSSIAPRSCPYTSRPASSCNVARPSRSRLRTFWDLPNVQATSALPSRTYHSGIRCGRPPGPIVAHVNTRSSSRKRASSGSDIVMLLRRDGISVPPDAVDHVTQRTTGEIAGEVVVEDGRDLVRGARPGDVRRHDHVVELPERMARRQRLAVEDVEHGARDLLALERGQERRLVDDGAASDVDQPAARLHRLERRGADD